MAVAKARVATTRAISIATVAVVKTKAKLADQAVSVHHGKTLRYQ
jgi:hypothetical protein